MDTPINWHAAAHFSGRIDFSFTRRLPIQAWENHLKSHINNDNKLRKLLEPSPKPEIDCVRLIDPLYPKNLAEQPFAPPVLYISGRKSLLSSAHLSMVGSRKSTYLGRQFAKQLSTHAVTLGYTVVSGLAYGIDEAVHRGALAQTIGVMGQGIAAKRSGSRKQLCEAILKAGGLLISEYPPIQTPQKWTYLHRNRLIAWMGNPFILVEAAQRSGAMNTTRLALCANKQVYVVPHHPLVQSAEGCLNLFLEGACPLIHPNQLTAPHQSKLDY
ncbi:MAG: DNA-processing protein DprA [Myxococcota bacterium]